jgi:uncharacterized membrane protein YccC
MNRNRLLVTVVGIIIGIIVMWLILVMLSR